MTRARQQLTPAGPPPAAQRVCGATGLCRIHSRHRLRPDGTVAPVCTFATFAHHLPKEHSMQLSEQWFWSPAAPGAGLGPSPARWRAKAWGRHQLPAQRRCCPGPGRRTGPRFALAPGRRDRCRRRATPVCPGARKRTSQPSAPWSTTPWAQFRFDGDARPQIGDITWQRFCPAAPEGAVKAPLNTTQAALPPCANKALWPHRQRGHQPVPEPRGALPRLPPPPRPRCSRSLRTAANDLGQHGITVNMVWRPAAHHRRLQRHPEATRS